VLKLLKKDLLQILKLQFKISMIQKTFKLKMEKLWKMILKKMPILPRLFLTKIPIWKINTRRKERTISREKEIFTIHQAKSFDNWLSSHITKISMEIKVSFTLWNRNIRLNFASTSWSTKTALLPSIANSPTDHKSWDSQMM
jgi:hypothetical protein